MSRLRVVLRWVALAGSALLLARTASAATVTDGDDFSVELPDTLCFEMPASLRDEGACAVTRARSHGVQWPSETTGLAVASMPVGKEGFGRLIVARMHATELIQTEEDAQAVVESSLQSRHQHSVPSATKLYTTADGLRIIRYATDDSEAFPPGVHVPDEYRLVHEASALAFTQDATYFLGAYGPKFVEADLDLLVDNSLSTMRARKPLQSTYFGRFLGIRWLPYLVFAQVLFVAFVVFLIFRARAWFRRWLSGA